MSDYFIGEIRLFPFAFAPQDWALCNGATLQVQQQVALFSLIGNQFGGDGRTTFQLPDFRGRTPVGANYRDSTHQQGKMGGEETVALTQSQIPQHTHTVNVNYDQGVKTATIPGSTLSSSGPGTSSGDAVPQKLFAVPGTLVPLHPSTVGLAGGGAGHENMQPSTVLNFCICISGVYPPRP